MMQRQILQINLLYCIGLFTILVLGAGCSSLPPVQKSEVTVIKETSSEDKLHLSNWKEGMAAFQNGDYRKAAALFEVMSENTENEKIRHRALYALAVTRLILAQSPEEFSQAMGVWECWSEESVTDLEGQDPRMITPFLERLVPPGTSESVPLPSAKKPSRNAEHSNIYNSYLTCKELLRARDKEIERIKSRLDIKEKEVKKLKKQINSLEEIHLKFQEKKQEISSP